MPRLFDLDRLNNVNAERAGLAAFRVIDSLQVMSAEEQVAGAALAFAALVDKYDVMPDAAFRVADNVVKAALQRVPELRALLAYVAGEL